MVSDLDPPVQRHPKVAFLRNTMRYCYNCNRVTYGKPLFCSFCGRSYNVKLCPRLHPNGRNAQACSQCGSRDLSTPAPKAPLWISLAAFGLSLLPGFLLTLVSLLFAIAAIHAIFVNPRMLLASLFLAFALAVLWAMWTRLPLALRQFIRKKLIEREKEGRRP
jgi:RNA polymerase subunit RPABC4/transcription elongation factor Spt4